MFNDIQQSKDTNEEFKSSGSYHAIEENKISFSVETLTNGHWPDQKVDPCILPLEMKGLTLSFEEFYNKKYQRRNLTWLFHHGQVELTPKFIT
jgi:Cullin family